MTTTNYLAIDIGGTNIKYATIDHSGNISDKHIIPTLRSNYQEFIEQLIKIVDDSNVSIRGVAISVPGRITHPDNIIHGGGILTFLDNKNIEKDLNLNVPVFVENDGKSATLAELWLGQLKGIKNGFMLVLGTGVGGGIVINDELYTGNNFASGEVSMMVEQLSKNIQDLSGYKGSAVEMIRKIMKFHPDSSETNGKYAFDLIKSGDLKANKIFDEYVTYIVKIINNIQAILDVRCIAIGGGISQQNILIERINEVYQQFYSQNQWVSGTLFYPSIVKAKFHNDSNLLGATYRFIQHANNEI